MAWKPDKDGIINGTENADTINWEAAWAEAITVNANGGNDTVNFTNSTYNNKLYGYGGNDTIRGGKGNDYIDGGLDDDLLYGTAGNNTIKGQSGNDTIHGAAGVDRLYGGNGNDLIYGYEGNDYIEGGSGNDTIDGGIGNDTISGIEGANLLKGQSGDDIINGGTGSDTIYGGNGNDQLLGGKGNDTIYGGSGNDLIKGHDGNDDLVGDEGNDTIEGGNGDDRLWGTSGSNVLKGQDGNDIIYGGTQKDTIWGGAGEDQLLGGSGNDIIHGEADNDIIKGNAGDDTIYGEDGNDSIRGNAGNDTLYGNDGDDNLRGEQGNNYIYGGNGNDFIAGGIGNDYIEGGDGVDKIYGEDGKDTIYGGNGGDYIYGEGGNDTIYTGAGDDQVLGGAGDDVIHADGENGYKILKGGLGNDSIIGGTGIDVIRGEDGNDTMLGGLGDDDIKGGAGDDYLSGNAGDDFLCGDAGQDTIKGGKGHDTINGGAGNDKIYGELGNDSINGGGGYNTIFIGENDGHDTITAGGGVDTVYFSNVYETDELNGQIVDNHVVITGNNGETATLENYRDGNHSVQYVQTKNGDKVRTEEIRNHIVSDAETIYGTDWGDDIRTNYGSEIHGGKGNDLIHITSGTYLDIYVEKGDDTVVIDANAMANIYFARYDGNNRLKGLNNISTASIYLNCDHMLLPTTAFTDGSLYYYMNAERNGDDLALKLTGSDETFTIEDYYNLTNEKKNRVYLDDQSMGVFKRVSASAKTATLDIASDETDFTVNNDNNLVFAKSNLEQDKTATIDGDYNTLIQNGKQHQTVNINGDSCTVYLENLGDKSQNTNTNVVNVTSSNNSINLKDGCTNTVTLFNDEMTNNSVYIHGGKNNTVTTSLDGSSRVDFYDSAGGTYDENIVHSYGNDIINFYTDYSNQVYLHGEGTQKTVYNHTNKSVKVGDLTTVNDVKVNLTVCSDDKNPKEFLVTHKNGDNYIYIRTKLEDGSITDNNFLIAGAYEDLNQVDSNGKSIYDDSLTLKYSGDDYSISSHLSGLTQYVDMSNEKTSLERKYYYIGNYGVMAFAKDVYIQGTNDKDLYMPREAGNLDKQYTINDAGGVDRMRFQGPVKGDTFRFFFDVDTSGNIVGKDLYILSSNDGGGSYSKTSLYKFIKNGDTSVNYIVVKDFFNGEGGYGIGRLEEILGPWDDPEHWETNPVCDVLRQDDYFAAVSADAASWLNSRNAERGTSYGTITEAIAAGSDFTSYALVDQYECEFTWSSYWDHTEIIP